MADGTLAAIQRIEVKHEHLQRFVGSFLGELYLANREAATAIAKKWAGGENAVLRHETCRALLWIPSEQFGPIEIEQLHQLVALNDPLLDRMVVGYFEGILRKVDSCAPTEAAQIVKIVALTCPR